MPSAPGRIATIWFDIGDLVDHFDWSLHPTGIQRVSLEILQAMHSRYPGRVAFCRLVGHTGRLAPVTLDDVVAATIPPAMANLAQGRTARLMIGARRVARWLARRPRRAVGDRLVGARATSRFARAAAPGDWLICLGLPWRNPTYGAAIAAAKRQHGLRFAMLIHDVLPFSHPDLCHPIFVAGFRKWFENTIGVFDLVFVASDFSRKTIRALCHESGRLAPVIERIPFGAGFSLDADGADAGRSPFIFPERFVLYVSSLERRKNHFLLLRVWRVLIARHGANAIPTLLFIGVGDAFVPLSATVRADARLRDKVMLIRGPSDAVVHDAYRRCLFTLYPSLVEGWGLPVAESLAAGKFCVASNRSSLPEVGGDLIDYFDPEDDDDAIRAIERALFDPGYLTLRTARIEAEYRAPTWFDCGTAIVGAVDALG